MRRNLPILLALLTMALGASWPGAARAGFLWDARVGVKGAVTGNLYAAPADKPFAASLPWDNDQFFVGGGAGLYTELTILGFLGLEVDVLWQRNAFMESMTWNGGLLTYDIVTRYDQVRVPVLVKGILPLGIVELSLGVGPEFIRGLSARVDLQALHSPLGTVPTAQADELRAVYGADTASGTALDVDLGVTIRVWKLAIPISLRAGFLLDQGKAYDERVTLVQSGGAYTGARVKALESYQFSLLAGIAYVF